jgi:hypothetical protein
LPSTRELASPAIVTRLKIAGATIICQRQHNPLASPVQVDVPKNDAFASVKGGLVNDAFGSREYAWSYSAGGGEARIFIVAHGLSVEPPFVAVRSVMAGASRVQRTSR